MKRYEAIVMIPCKVRFTSRGDNAQTVLQDAQRAGAAMIRPVVPNHYGPRVLEAKYLCNADDATISVA